MAECEISVARLSRLKGMAQDPHGKASTLATVYPPHLNHPASRQIPRMSRDKDLHDQEKSELAIG
jgi:hypothetical protein